MESPHLSAFYDKTIDEHHYDALVINQFFDETDAGATTADRLAEASHSAYIALDEEDELAAAANPSDECAMRIDQYEQYHDARRWVGYRDAYLMDMESYCDDMDQLFPDNPQAAGLEEMYHSFSDKLGELAIQQAELEDAHAEGRPIYTELFVKLEQWRLQQSIRNELPEDPFIMEAAVAKSILCSVLNDILKDVPPNPQGIKMHKLLYDMNGVDGVITIGSMANKGGMHYTIDISERAPDSKPAKVMRSRYNAHQTPDSTVITKTTEVQPLEIDLITTLDIAAKLSEVYAS